jgi:AraC-like DNA-binding protein
MDEGRRMTAQQAIRSDRGARAADPRGPVHVATNFARPLARSLRARGIDPATVLGALAGADLPPRVPFAIAARAWEAASATDPLVGIDASKRIVAGDFGLLEYLTRSSPTLGASIAKLARYHRLLNDRAGVELLRDAETARVRYTGPSLLAMPRAYVDFVLATWARVACESFEAEAGLLGASFPFAPPDDPAPYREMFGAALEFDAPHAELRVASSVLDRVVGGSDAALAFALEQHAASVLAASLPASAWRARVSVELEARLCEGTPRLDAVAASLGVSARALRRRLESEGSSFAATVEELRRRLALEWVEDPALSLGEIAFLLGFSEASAFHRAFRRWTGRTPRAGRVRSGRVSPSGTPRRSMESP